MAKKPVKYYVVDAFTDSAFKGNPAAVCLLEQDRDDDWLQSLAAEFNISETCFLTPVHASHILFSSGLVDNNVIEFETLSGTLTVKKIPSTDATGTPNSQSGEAPVGFYIELDFPADPTTESNSDDTSLISEALNGASIMDIKRTQDGDNLIVVVASGKNVTEVQPQLDVIVKCPGMGIILTGIAPPESGFDFYSRYFSPKFGINEDPVTGSAHCSLVPYWSKKLGKFDLRAYQASARGGILDLHLDEQKQRVFLRGKAVTVMEGFVLV